MGEARIVVLPPVIISGVGCDEVAAIGDDTKVVSSLIVGTFPGLKVPTIGKGLTVTAPAMTGATSDAWAAIGEGVTTALV
jgi:hypothetical protein